MSQQVAPNGNAPPASVVENVLMRGDLSKLTAAERSNYYLAVCRSVGLNPLTKPFEYITLNGKLTLYALRNCTDQLRTIYGVSVIDLTESEREGVFIVTAKVQDAKGRSDIAKGAVNIAGLKGEPLANALMKAETKAKRRATLSICGLGMLDETEVEDVPATAKVTPRQVVPTEDDYITEEQEAELVKLLAAANREVEKFCNWQKIDKIADLPAGRFDAVKQQLETIILEAA